jgi:hypothetical protein
MVVTLHYAIITNESLEVSISGGAKKLHLKKKSGKNERLCRFE